MSRVLFLQPFVESGGRRVHYLRDWSGGEMPTSIAFPPMECALAAALLRNRGVDVALLDADVLALSEREMFERIIAVRPDFVAVPSAWGSFRHDIALLEKIKRALPGSRTILFGPNVTVSPESVLETGVVDYAILGEPEKPVWDIVQGEIEENTAYLENGRLVLLPRRLFEPLDDLPYPARDLLPNERYRFPLARRDPFAAVSTSRGCAHSCKFCPVHIWGQNRLRFRSPGHVLGELEEICSRFGIREIQFRDPTFSEDRERTMELCRRMAERVPGISWRCSTRVDRVDPELLGAMAKAGCYQVAYGFENASQQVLDKSGKNIRVEQSRRAAAWTRATGIEVCGAFMLGMPGDDDRSIRETVRLALELHCDYAQFQLASPLPSTPYGEECGYPAVPGDTAGNRWFDWKLARKAGACGGDELHAHLLGAYRRFYCRPSLWLRQLTKVRTPGQLFRKIRTAMRLLRGLR